MILLLYQLSYPATGMACGIRAAANTVKSGLPYPPNAASGRSIQPPPNTRSP